MSEECCENNNGKPAKTDVLQKDINKTVPIADANDEGHDHEENGDEHTHDGELANKPWWLEHWSLLTALLILVTLLVLEYAFDIKLQFPMSLIVNGIAYLLAGWNVLALAFRKASRADFFNEFVLMSVATLGAFLIGEYSEGVAVMVFYSIGEWFQDSAVSRAKASIKALLDIRPDSVTVIRDGKSSVISPSEI